jgi:hypothetical protein
MIYAEIFASIDTGAAEAIAAKRLLTIAQEGSFTLMAKGNAHKKHAIEQANSYIEVGPYKAVRVFQGKRVGKMIYQAHADINKAAPAPI